MRPLTSILPASLVLLLLVASPASADQPMSKSLSLSAQPALAVSVIHQSGHPKHRGSGRRELLQYAKTLIN
jgi:hypothetical protein